MLTVTSIKWTAIKVKFWCLVQLCLLTEENLFLVFAMYPRQNEFLHHLVFFDGQIEAFFALKKKVEFAPPLLNNSLAPKNLVLGVN